ncbi:MAG: hypothetical protein AAGJ18_30695, partial [Bacteroidota bacterium]
YKSPILKISFTYFLTIGLLLVSCGQISEEVENVTYEGEIAIPIIESGSVSFLSLWNGDVPGQSLLVQSDGSLIFRYDNQPIVVTTEDILGTLDLPIVTALTDTLTLLPFELPANIILDQAIISEGSLLFRYEPTDEVEEIIFTLPQLSIDGEVLTVRTGGGNGSTVPLDLSGYTFEPTRNQLEIRYTALDGAGNPTLLDNAGILARPVLQFVKGNWGREMFQLSTEVIPIDLYDDRVVNGQLFFSEPTITATIQSSFGVPIRTQIDILRGRTQRGDMPIDPTAIDGVDINFPTERGQSKTTVLQLDYTNSNIVEVFDAQLTEIEYGLTAITNPDNDDNLIAFLEDTSSFRAEVVVEVPVVGRTENFVAVETFDTPFDEIDDLSEGEFKLIVDNELPIAADLQFFFLDNNQQILDSLFEATTNLVPAASVDTNGQVTAKVSSTTFVPVAAAKMEQLLQASQIQAVATFQTTNNGQQEVVLNASQFLRFRMGLKFKP